MSIPNKSSRRCWAYEDTVNTPAIDAVDDTTYFFGNTQGEKEETWEPPAPQHPNQAYYNYSKRMPVGLSRLDPKRPEFNIAYNPTTSQFLARFLGNNVTGTPITHDPLNTGEKYAYTYRHELRGGSTEELHQAVGCKTIGLTIIGNIREFLQVTEIAAYGYLEDQGDQSILTTTPTAAGALTSGAYVGLPHLYWDSDEMIDIVGFNFSQKQNYSKDYDPATGKNHVYGGTFEPAQIVLKALMQDEDSYEMWDDYKDRLQKDAYVIFKKTDDTNYVRIDLADCYITDWKKSGKKDMGHYDSTIYIECPDVSGSANFLNEGANFDTHFKAAYS